MNAKETIKKIADALNIGAEETTKVEETKVEDKKEVVEPTEIVTEDVKAEAVTEDTKEVKTTEVVAETTEVAEDVKETPKEDTRITDLQKQVDELSKLLEVAVSKDADTIEDTVPEIPQAEVQPLTHSPETTPDSNRKKIGGHGGDVLSRVYKYMS